MNIFTKNTAIIVFLLLFSFYAQYTAITNSNIEQELINKGDDSGGILNGQVLTEDISSIKPLNVTGTLNPTSQKISRLLGIEDYTALKTLLCSNNNLIAIIDLGANVQPERLECGFNDITNLDGSANELNGIILGQNTKCFTK